METNNYIVNYLKSNYHKNNINQVLQQNSLQYILSDYFVAEMYDNNRIELLLNESALIQHSHILMDLCKIFENNKIKYITFKGILLSNLLYEIPYYRIVGDIDIYIEPSNYLNALNLLKNYGFKLSEKNGAENPHHIVLNKDGIILELHKEILTPKIKINSDYLINHLEKIFIMNREITTFDTTATLLQLIYHLHMDTHLATQNIFANKSMQKARRFLYRAYEIALFSEKYYNQIKWDDIIEDIKKQKLRIFFKKMIMDILEIFPNAFPECFIHTVFQLDYIKDERDQLYKYLVESEIKEKGKAIDCILSNYVNDNWKIREGKNVHKKVGTSFNLTKKFSDGKAYQELSCTIDSEKVQEGLKLSFKVSNDDFYFSDIDNHDTQASDGVHLLLCGTEEYSYNSIFFFPKEINGKIKVVVCDVLNNRNIVLEDNLIRAEFLKTDEYYIITAILSNEFIEEHHLASYFYMGLVVSNCSSETHRRKNQLILSEEDSQWYNPTYFAKIDMK